jgi:hypothetical protein
LVALSDAIREDLTSRFGAAWRAKTTEEFSADSVLEQALGDEDHVELIRFLEEIDHLKFAPQRLEDGDGVLRAALEGWEPRIARLRGKIAAQPKGRAARQAGQKEARPASSS